MSWRFYFLNRCIEDLREKREELNKQIMKEEEDKGRTLAALAASQELARGCGKWLATLWY